MIIDEVVLHNFGVFKGRQSLELTPPSKAKPLTLIAGLNGCGKTTILDAVQLALYGSLARTGARRGVAYEQYLHQSIHRSVDPTEGAAVAVGFHVYQDGMRHDYQVYRSWSFSGKRIREHVDVVRDGRKEPNLTAHWAEHVESFVPRGIAPLFFFDGEQIESLADLDNSQAMLRTAINALLGLELTDRLTADLTVLERRTREKAAPEAERQEVERCRDQLAELRHLEEQGAQELAASRVRLERAEKALFAVEERYRLEGGELFEQRSSTEHRLSSARLEVKMVDEELRELAGGAAPFVLVLDLLEQAIDQANRERRGLEERLISELLIDRDATILAVLKSARASKAAVLAVEGFCEQDRQSRAAATEDGTVVGLAGEDVALAVGLVQNLLPEVQTRIGRLMTRRLEQVARIDQLERELASIPAEDALAAQVGQLDDARRSLAATQADFQRSEGQLSAVRAERMRADESYERLLMDASHASLAAEDQRRLIEHARRARETLQAFRVLTTRRHVDRIAGFVMEALHRLLRKELLITDIRIDPETYDVRLRGQGDAELFASQMSAGERQLLAIALLWGLARAGGQPLPVIIDTPLGRLDGSHRDRLIDRYFPQASHQVILLSTDQEIDEDAWSKLEGRTGHAYELVFDEAAGGTSIQPGYFWSGPRHAG